MTVDSVVSIGPVSGRAGESGTDSAARRGHGIAGADIGALVIREPDGMSSLTLLVENLNCAGCIAKVERALSRVPGVVEARVNLSTRRARIRWRDGTVEPERFLLLLDEIGYPARPFDLAVADRAGAAEEKDLLRCMAVAGFAAANVMLLSVSVWSGAASDMAPATRDLFHWVSALIALPAIAYAGRPFFRSAWTALATRQLGMDVPISLAVVLAASMSLLETARSGEHAYFDAAVTLLFFLLLGRYLDRRMRARARRAAERLLSYNRTHVTVLAANGKRHSVPIAAVTRDMIVECLAGERIPVDGLVVDGAADIDASVLTGESAPISVTTGADVHAGTLNLNGALAVRVRSAGEETLLAEIVRLVETAEQGRARYIRIADRVARIYSPAVHVLALATFLGWWGLGGSGAWESAAIAITVLIITCPCALGLAVPAVQVAAVGELLRAGVLVKSADALERLAVVDTVLFDKTGTLTEGRPELVLPLPADREALAPAAAVAWRSRHPLAQAFAAAFPEAKDRVVSSLAEFPGAGLSAVVHGCRVSVGSRAFCEAEIPVDGPMDDSSEIWVRMEGGPTWRLGFRDRPRGDAAATIAELRGMGLRVRLLSGDRQSAVEALARHCGIDDWQAQCLPADKVAVLEAERLAGRNVLMVGDGINDAPALAAASVGMSPGSAATISQMASDLVFLGARLQSVALACRMARDSNRLVRQNLILAIGYNAIAVPIAIAGFVTPLVAAVAMSSSSVIVTANALRLKLRGTRK